jgi:type VI secretion system protein ImpH
MADEIGHSDQIKEQDLIDKASHYSFIQAYRLLCDLVIAQKSDPLQCVRIRPALHLSVSSSQVQAITKAQRQELSVYTLEVNFAGLYGQDTPLPRFITEELMQAQAQDKSSARLFLDLIHQRLYQLYFKAQTKNLAFIQQDGSQQLHDFMLSMVGFRDRQWLADFPDQAFILRNINLFRHQKGTAAGLRQLIKQLFPKSNVTIDQCSMRWLRIPVQQRLGIGTQGNSLGQQTLLGRKMIETLAKVTIVVGPVQPKQYRHWVINEKNWRSLQWLVRYFLGQPLVVDILFDVDNKGEFNCQLSTKDNFRLGQNTWLVQCDERHLTADLKLL